MRLFISAFAFFILYGNCLSQDEKKIDWRSYDFVVYTPSNYTITHNITNNSVSINDIFNTEGWLSKTFKKDIESDRAAKLYVLDDDKKSEWLSQQKSAVCFVVIDIAFIYSTDNNDDLVSVKWMFYDLRRGWDEPIQIYQEEAEIDVSSRNFMADALQSISECSESISRRVRSESGYSKYDVDTAWRILGDDYRIAFDIMISDVDININIEDEFVVYDNIFVEGDKEHNHINSVFVVSLASNTCNGIQADAQGLAQLVSVKLMSEYKILDRSNLTALIDEQKLSLSGLTDESTVLSLGKLKGAEGVLFCQESCLSEQQILTVKLLDCTSGEQKWIATGLDCDPLDLMRAIEQEIGL